MLLLDPREARVHVRRIAPDLCLQEGLQPVETELLACRVAGLGDAVGVEADDLIGRERDLRRAVRAPREEGERQAVRRELLDVPVLPDDETLVVPRVGVLDL